MLKLCCCNKIVLYYKNGEYCIYCWVYIDIKNNICVDERILVIIDFCIFIIIYEIRFILWIVYINIC